MLNDIHNIKLQGKANIPEKLEMGHNYKIEADCSITQIKEDDNYDGTHSFTYKAEPVTVSIKKDNGEIIKAKDPRKNSVKIRNTLFKFYATEGLTEPFDEVYDAVTWEICSLIPALVKGGLQRLKN